MQAQPQNTVPFPQKENKTVTEPLLKPVMERFVVPAAWFAGGILFAKLFLNRKATL